MRSFRGRPADVGQARSQYLAVLFGRELRLARMIGGLSQAQLARLAGVTQTRVSRAERGATGIPLGVRCRLAAAAGHELGWHLYPVATVRLRDSGQLTIAQAIVAVAHSSWQPRLEAPIAPGDGRAADLLLTGPEQIIHVEIERALVDVQAQLRSAQLKRQALTGGIQRTVRLILAVPDSRTSRARLAPFAELLSRTLPVSSALAWRAIRSGEQLPGDGILFVRATRPG